MMAQAKDPEIAERKAVEKTVAGQSVQALGSGPSPVKKNEICSYCRSKLHYEIQLEMSVETTKENLNEIQKKNPNEQASQCEWSEYSATDTLMGLLLRQRHLVTAAKLRHQDNQQQINELDQEMEVLQAKHTSSFMTAVETEQLRSFRAEFQDLKNQLQQQKQKLPPEAHIEQLRDENLALQKKLDLERQELAALRSQTQQMRTRYDDVGGSNSDSLSFEQLLQHYCSTRQRRPQVLEQLQAAGRGEVLLKACETITRVVVFCRLQGVLLQLHESFHRVLDLPPLPAPRPWLFQSSSPMLKAVIDAEAAPFPSGFARSLSDESPVLSVLSVARGGFRGELLERHCRDVLQTALQFASDTYHVPLATLQALPVLSSYTRDLLLVTWRSHLHPDAWGELGQSYSYATTSGVLSRQEYVSEDEPPPPIEARTDNT